MDVAKFRGAKGDEDGIISMAEFDRVGLPMVGGCAGCGASVAAYNMYPSKSGYVCCKDCIYEKGFSTVEEFEQFHDDAEMADQNERLRAHAERVVRDLHQLQGLCKRGKLTLPNAFVEGNFEVGNGGEVQLRGSQSVRDVALPVDHPEEGTVFDVGSQENIPATREQPEDWDFVTLFPACPTHMTAMWIALMFIRYEIDAAVASEEGDRF
jgi:hypothetical protein